MSLLLNPPAATAEAHEPRPHAPQEEKYLQLEARAQQVERSPPSLQLEKALAQQHSVQSTISK